MANFFTFNTYIASSLFYSAEGRCKKEMERHEASYDALRVKASNALTDIDKELSDHFSIRH
jgi:hypothetical protein